MEARSIDGRVKKGAVWKWMPNGLFAEERVKDVRITSATVADDTMIGRKKGMWMKVRGE